MYCECAVTKRGPRASQIVQRQVPLNRRQVKVIAPSKSGYSTTSYFRIQTSEQPSMVRVDTSIKGRTEQRQVQITTVHH